MRLHVVDAYEWHIKSSRNPLGSVEAYREVAAHARASSHRDEIEKTIMRFGRATCICQLTSRTLCSCLFSKHFQRTVDKRRSVGPMRV